MKIGKIKSNTYVGVSILIAICIAVGWKQQANGNPFWSFLLFSPYIADTSSDSLKFQIYDQQYLNPQTDTSPVSIDLEQPPNIIDSITYDTDSNVFILDQYINNLKNRPSTYWDYEDYKKWQFNKDENAYFQQRLEALSMFQGEPQLPTLYREGLFDRLFGGKDIDIKPQGTLEATLNGFWENRENPNLLEDARKVFIPEFDMNMNVNLIAKIGDKLKLNISNNTNPTLLNQNLQRIEYTGKEDEIIKKIELGNVNFPLRSSLINGVQSLFGAKTQLQFGRLWVTAVASQQKSQRKSLTIQGGAQNQQFEIDINNYEENKNFLLGQYFYDNYDKALERYPIINSQIQISKIEVWITNRNEATNGIRDIMAFMDLGEKKPYQTFLTDPAGSTVPDNRSNKLYDALQQDPLSRQQSTATQSALSIGLSEGQDFQRATMRQLSTSEYALQPQLGYITLNMSVYPDDILAVSYRFTYNGKVYQVGEFSDEMPPDTASQKVMFAKLLKGTSNRPQLPVWNLMMKNVYAIGVGSISKEMFRLNIFYKDPGGGEKRYLPEGPMEGIPLLNILNLDRLNTQNDPQPDGIFDFVENITINAQQGKIIFPVLEPFADGLEQAVGSDPKLRRKYLFTTLYDSTKIQAQQQPQSNRYVIKGSFQSAFGTDIFLGGFNIPEGSVTVTAGGTKLTENVDYQVNYAASRIKILNQGILNSGLPINIEYEDNAAFGLIEQSFMGSRFDYFLNEKVTLGATYMKLSERPWGGYKTRYGDDPIKNTVVGADFAYQSEFPKLTKLIDKLPFYSTSMPSMIAGSVEGAAIFPGHHRFANIPGDEGGTQFIDDFEGASGTIDIKFPYYNWSLSSVPSGAKGPSGNILFPEASLYNDLRSGYNRANISWYTLEPNIIMGRNVPQHIKDDTMRMHYWRQVSFTDLFPQKTSIASQNILTTFDIGYYPTERGPYNFDVNNIDPADGSLLNPKDRWGGIQRSIDNLNSDFESANVEYITFWMMDPFIYDASSQGGYLYFNLGSVSEDVLKDGRMGFENGIPYPKDPTKLEKTAWGFIPKFQQQITRNFLNNPEARKTQDVGYDLMDDEEEKVHFNDFITAISAILPAGSDALNNLLDDPASDNFKHFRNIGYDQTQTAVLDRYRRYNRPHGNSPVNDVNSDNMPGSAFPESEDFNRDNSLNENESYYQYRMHLRPNMLVGEEYIVDKRVAQVKLKNGRIADETWYQFKIPIRSYADVVGGIGDFRSIRFIRMFLSGFEDSVILRFAQLQFDRNNWRRYQYSLINPGENIPEDDMNTTSYGVTTVSVEQNSDKIPVPYIMPPGIERQEQPISSGQNIQLDEQSVALQVCGLKDGDARAMYKNIGGIDLRQYDRLKMFIHAESVPDELPLKDGDLYAFIRMGSDFTSNYYEYRIPLQITPDGSRTPEAVWPEANRMDVDLKAIIALKNERNNAGAPSYIPYSTTTPNGHVLTVIGNPNVAEVNNIMLGVLNPQKTQSTPLDDGLRKCVEVWFNELRVTGMNETPAYAAAANVNIQMADLGNIQLAGSMHTVGYGNISQKLNDRFKDNFHQFNGTTNLNMGKLLPNKWGVTLPVFFGYSENVSNPKYDPYDMDVLLSEKLKTAADPSKVRAAAQDYNSITSFNINNLRIMGNPENKRKFVTPFSLKNFDFQYSYNRQFKRNPLLEFDEFTDQKLGIGYTYKIPMKHIEPFRNFFKDRTDWWNLIKDFNFNPLPSSITFRNDLRRLHGETIVRNIDDGNYQLPKLYFKNFTWDRYYNFSWELTKALSLAYTATNQARIDEPYGELDTKEKRDTVWQNLLKFGRNTYFTHNINANYTLPTKKIPALDWMTITTGYNTQYFWTAASTLAQSLGNTIANNQTKTVNAQFNFTQLYNKSRWLKAVNKPANRYSSSGSSRQTSSRSLDGTTSGETSIEKKPEELNDKAPKKRNPIPLPPKPKKKIITVDSIQGHDTMQKYDLRIALRDLKRKERRRYRKEIIAWRKKKQNILPEISQGERTAGQLASMIKNVNINYTETQGTILPGYMDSSQYFGINNRSMAPGLFAFGYQPDAAWMMQEAMQNRITRDSIFNAQFQQQFGRIISARATLEPFTDFRIDLTYNSNFQKNYNEIFKYNNDDGLYHHYNPYDMGAFNISIIGIKTMFDKLYPDKMSESFANMLDYRKIISHRLGNINPYTDGLPDPLDPEYAKGYGRYSQDVVIPAFLAAYMGKDPNTSPLIVYENRTNKSNPFKNFKALPNWSITYNGLSRLDAFKNSVQNFTISHTYIGSMAMNSFSSNLFFQDYLGIGFPSFIDSISGNYIPYFLVPNVTVTESFSPIAGIDASFNNSLTLRLMFNKSRQLSLSLIDYQVVENKNTELIVSVGYRLKGLNLPFTVFGISELKNDLNFRADLGYRNDLFVNSYMATQTIQATRGQKMISIAPSVDYIVNDKIQIRLFFDRKQTVPAVSQSFPISTTRGGITVRYIFADGQ